MDVTYWFKQSNHPLFPEIEWSKPERRDQSGKLLIIGGSSQGFVATAKTQQNSIEAGVGQVRLILPNSLSAIPGLKQTPGVTLVTSTKNGSLGLDSWPEVQAGIDWADMIALPGDLGRNYETIQLIGKIINSSIPLVLNQEVVELVSEEIASLSNREDTVLFCDLKLLQKLAKSMHASKTFTLNMSLSGFADSLHELTAGHNACLVSEHNEMVVIAQNGRISTTKTSGDEYKFSKIAVYCLQNPGRYFEAATTAVAGQS